MTPVHGSGTRRDIIEPFPSRDHPGGTPMFIRFMACYRCNGCNALNIASATVSYEEFCKAQEEVEEWIADDPYVLMYSLQWLPQDTRGKRFPDVPAPIAGAASEAHVCAAVEAHRGAIILARSVIEAVAKDKGITHGMLIEKIDEMHEKKLIRAHVRDGAHEVRHLANDMAHGNLAELVAKEDADLILALTDEILLEVYQSPARVERARAARMAKRDARQGQQP